MIIQEMVYLFKLQAERVDTKKSPDLSLAKIIIILNSAEINLVKAKCGIQNGLRQGYESTQKRIQDLQKITVLGEPLNVIQNNQEQADLFQFDLNEAVKPVLFVTRVRFKAKKGKCAATLIGVDTQTDDLNIIDQSAFATPSFEWRETNYRTAGDFIHAESDGTFILEKALVDYVRYPIAMDIAGYKHFDGSDSTDIDCELKFPDEVIDQAAFEFKLWSQDPSYQFAQMKQGIAAA